MSYDNLGECEVAYSRDELKEYLEGIGTYEEPPNRYLDRPPVDISTRLSCINSLYERNKDQYYIKKFMSALLELSNEGVEQLQIAMRYIIKQLVLEENKRASFELNDEEFYEQLKQIIIAKQHDIELANMQQTFELHNQRISSMTGYSIK